jgi:toxin ParE1/3/4
MAIILKKPLASADLLDIWDFIANDSFEKADRFLQKIESQLKILHQTQVWGENVTP